MGMRRRSGNNDSSFVFYRVRLGFCCHTVVFLFCRTFCEVLFAPVDASNAWLCLEVGGLALGFVLVLFLIVHYPLYVDVVGLGLMDAHCWSGGSDLCYYLLGSDDLVPDLAGTRCSSGDSFFAFCC